MLAVCPDGESLLALSIITANKLALQEFVIACRVCKLAFVIARVCVNANSWQSIGLNLRLNSWIATLVSLARNDKVLSY